MSCNWLELTTKVLGTCTQVLFKVLVLVLKYFWKSSTCTCTCTRHFFKYLYLYSSTFVQYLPQAWSTNFIFFVNYRLRSTCTLCMMVIIVIACVLSTIMLIWELSCERWSLPGDLKTSPSARFSNHSGRDQLSQVGFQMNIITSKHTLLYK